MRSALAKERFAILHPAKKAPVPYVTQCLPEGGGPVIATTDFMRAVPDQIARWVPDRFVPLGTDGFGLSDTREALRRFFEIDPAAIVTTALSTLSREGKIPARDVTRAMKDLGVDPEQVDPVSR